MSLDIGNKNPIRNLLRKPTIAFLAVSQLCLNPSTFETRKHLVRQFLNQFDFVFSPVTRIRIVEIERKFPFASLEERHDNGGALLRGPYSDRVDARVGLRVADNGG